MKENWKKYRYIAGMILCVIAFLNLILPRLFSEKPSSADFGQVIEKTFENVDMTMYPQRDDAAIRKILGLDPSDYEGIWFGRTDNSLNAQEALIVKFDPDQEEKLEEKINERIASQTEIYGGYAPESAQTAKDAIVQIHPNYLIYVAGENAAQIAQQFGRAL